MPIRRTFLFDRTTTSRTELRLVDGTIPTVSSRSDEEEEEEERAMSV